MSNKKTVAIIIVFVVMLALVIQFARSEYAFVKHVNDGTLDGKDSWKRVNSIPQDEINKKERDSYLLVIDSKDNNSLMLKEQTAQVLKLMKKDFEIQDVDYESSLKLDTKNIVICIRSLSGIANIDSLMKHVEDGGNVFFEACPYADSGFYRIYRKLGIIEFTEGAETEGVKLVSNVILKAKDTSLGKDFITNYSLAVTLDKKCRVHVKSMGNMTLLWDTNYGKGRIMVFNGTMLNEKRSRGLVTGAISLLSDDYIYPVFNLKVTYIDDFPAPFPEGYDKNIYNDYGRTTRDFLRDVWWSDMLRIKSMYDVDYTGAIIMTYDDRVEAPYGDIKKIDLTNLMLYGRELLKNGGELCVHGYNHQSLVTKDDPKATYVKNELEYNLFDNEANITESLKTFDNFFRSVYKEYKLTCYVPPSNVIGEVGRKALKKAMPDLETIASVYYNNMENGVYEQEIEISEDGVLELPRFTYGFLYDELNYWSLINNINTSGMVSHFCHPDDVLDTERNRNNSWDVMSKEFEEFYKKIKDDYPWLRSMTITKAGNSARKILATETYIEYGEKEIKGYMNGFESEYYFILRTNKKAFSMENCMVKQIDDGVYLVNTRDSVFTVGLKGE